MQDEPKPTELIKAVADFLRNDIAPAISGHNAFKLRVSINALELVTRQLALQQAGDAARIARGAQPRACRSNRNREGRSADAGAVRSPLADHACQARSRSAELCGV